MMTLISISILDMVLGLIMDYGYWYGTEYGIRYLVPASSKEFLNIQATRRV